MTGRPAATLLHLESGFSNILANLHNARRARVPLVNCIGEHAVRHLAFNAAPHTMLSLTGSAIDQ
jgi:acetolactate synthase-1/2/3 large subunit